jgi:hypothetical protein
LRYPHDDLTDAMGEDREDLQYPKVTDFDTFTQHVKQRDGLTSMEAMTRARKENPELFRRSQGSTTTLTTKRAASPSYESLVAEQIAKGCSPNLAAQRVAQAHGYPAVYNRSRISKSEVLADGFAKRAEDLAYEEGLSLCDAMRKLRLSNPRKFERMQG